MKLIIQIPCYDEAATLPLVLGALPREVPGIDVIEVLVLDDGSTDGTGDVARRSGATVSRSPRNLGLARTFRRGLLTCVERGADVIVNLDGDHQYPPDEIPRLIAPILRGEADMVVANRQTDRIPHFSPLKKRLQRLGSAVVRRISGVPVTDAVSGFRAFSRTAALRLTVVSAYTYTLETLLQAPSKDLTVAEIDVLTLPNQRTSRLIRSLPSYLGRSGATLARVFTMYHPLQVFLSVGAAFFGAGFLLGMRFLYFFTHGDGGGHVQSLILAAILMILGVLVGMGGLLADLISFNRILLEEVVERVRALEAAQGAGRGGDGLRDRSPGPR